MADVCVVIRYRRAVTYGVHALMAALESANPGCDVRFGATAGECAELIAASEAERICVQWSFYSPDADAMAAELAAVGARIHTHTFMPLPGTPWRDAEPAVISLATMQELDRLAQRGMSYGNWRKQAEHSARLARTAREYPRRTKRRRVTG